MQRHYCSNCGKPLEPDANFCAYCGAKQQSQDPGIQQLPNQEPSLTVDLPPPQPQPPQTTDIQSDVYSHDGIVVIPRRRLSPRAKVIFFLNYIVMSSVVLPFLIAYIFFEPTLALSMLACYFILCYVITEITYNHFYFSIDEHGFEKDHGVFYKRHVSIPFEQIQNVNTTRTLFDHLLGTARLEIETAGSSSPRKREIVGGVMSNSEGMLPGIGAEEARQLHDLLLRKVADSDNN